MANFGRRTWDREEYRLLAQEDPLRHEEALRQTLGDAKLQQLKQKYTDHNKLIKESMGNLNKKVLVTGISSYKRGKQFGFYCDLCDLTFKDTAQYIDHLNHKTHQIKFESIFEEKLVADLRNNDEVPLQEFNEEYKELVRRFILQHASNDTPKINKSKTKLKSTSKRAGTGHNALEQSMGFTSFGSTKN